MESGTYNETLAADFFFFFFFYTTLVVQLDSRGLSSKTNYICEDQVRLRDHPAF